MSIDEYGVAHHGPPIMTEADVRLCAAMSLWIETARAGKVMGYGEGWVPSHADIIKSRLFWRIRSGKPPLPAPPPTSFSCPWYEVIEEIRPHYCFECWFGDDHPDKWGGGLKGKVIICQVGYDLIERHGDAAVVGFGPWRFKLWRDVEKWKVDHAELVARFPDKYPQPGEGWLLQRDPSLEVSSQYKDKP